MSPLWFASASTMSFPLWSTCFLISIPRLEKKPFEIPRSSGNPFAIGSVSTVTVVSFDVPGAPAADPPRAASSTSTQATKTSLRGTIILPPPPGSIV